MLNDQTKASIRLLLGSLSKNEEQILNKVILTKHTNDRMYDTNNVSHYLSVGLSALRVINDGLLYYNRPRTTINSILDFPSGYARILRFLVSVFDENIISIGDIDQEAVNFCSSLYNVGNIESNIDFDAIKNNQKFDLIWCGSLATHLNENKILALLNFIHRSLHNNGLCFLTTHGLKSVALMQQNGITYGLDRNQRDNIIAQYYSNGFAYENYVHKNNYGISIVKQEYMTNLINHSMFDKNILFMYKAWDNHQDVYVIKK